MIFLVRLRNVAVPFKEGAVRMKRGCSGSITIYLSLIFMIMLSLIMAVVEDVRSQAIALQLECAMDLSLYSVFAEYNRELLEQYDLFFVDTSYGTNSPGVNNMTNHLKGYMEDNLTLESDMGQDFMWDFLKLQVRQTEALSYAKATDEGGKVFKRQAIAYMSDKYGLDYFNRISDSLSQVWEKELLTRDVTSQRNANEQQIDAIELPKKKISEDEYEEIELDNPADGVNATRNAGVLSLVIDDISALSASSINPDSYISKRTVSEGSGLMGRDAPVAAQDILYHEYILEKSSYYTQVLEKAALKYQVEYILAGKNTDMENLKWVVNRLLLLREVANVTYLFSDPAKMTEAETLALTLAAVIAVPQLCELVKTSILFAWAYAESVYDVKVLLNGGKIPLIKTGSTWHYSLEEMLQYQNGLSSVNPGGGNNPDGTGTGTGLSYKDYLRILLYTVSERDSIYRMMDIIEMDIRRTTGNMYFCMDACMDYLQVKVIASSPFKAGLQIIREYYY